MQIPAIHWWEKAPGIPHALPSVRTSPIAVDDVASCLIDASLNPRVRGRTVEIGGPEALSPSDWIRLAGEERGNPSRNGRFRPPWPRRDCGSAPGCFPIGCLHGEVFCDMVERDAVVDPENFIKELFPARLPDARPRTDPPDEGGCRSSPRLNGWHGRRSAGGKRIFRRTAPLHGRGPTSRIFPCLRSQAAEGGGGLFCLAAGPRRKAAWTRGQRADWAARIGSPHPFPHFLRKMEDCRVGEFQNEEIPGWDQCLWVAAEGLGGTMGGWMLTD